MATLNAYLSFDGNCREAMNFYQSCIGGEVKLQTVGESPLATQMPPQYKDQILHSSLVSGLLILMASDMHRTELRDGNTVQLCLNCGSIEELHRIYENLSKGGETISPVTEMPWGAHLGELTDKFGKIWILHFDKNGAQ